MFVWFWWSFGRVQMFCVCLCGVKKCGVMQRCLPQPCSFGKNGSPEASGDAGGRLGRHKKKKNHSLFYSFL